MKRTSVIIMALVLTALLGVAIAQEVYSVNVVGFVKKELPAGGVIMTTCNFDPVGGGTNTLLGVFGTNQLKQADAVAACDRIVLFDSASKIYQTWAQYTDGIFYKANSQQEFDLNLAGNPEVPPGSAMWLVAGGGGATKDIVFMGEVVDVATQQVSIVAGAQLVAYPFTSPIALQDTAFQNQGTKSDILAAADRISVWLGSGYQTYGLASDGMWYKGNTQQEYDQSVLASNTLQLAEGFWYVARGAFPWTEESMYINNL